MNLGQQHTHLLQTWFRKGKKWVKTAEESYFSYKTGLCKTQIPKGASQIIIHGEKTSIAVRCLSKNETYKAIA